jgi:predicted metallopeptidase
MASIHSFPRLDQRGFDFTGHMRRLCADMAERVEELRHIDLDRVAVRFCQARKGGPYGIQASLTPLRFHEGRTTALRRGRLWRIQPLYDSGGREMLYLLSFYLPRFLDLPLAEKLTTVVHELWHIGPQFDGNLRRHPGRCYSHTHSQRQFDEHAARLADRWIAASPPAEVYGFLRHDFRRLHALHGGVYGQRIPTPKLLRVDAVSPRSVAG